MTSYCYYYDELLSLLLSLLLTTADTIIIITIIITIIIMCSVITTTTTTTTTTIVVIQGNVTEWNRKMAELLVFTKQVWNHFLRKLSILKPKVQLRMSKTEPQNAHRNQYKNQAGR